MLIDVFDSCSVRGLVFLLRQDCFVHPNDTYLDSIFVHNTLFTDAVDLMRPIDLEIAIHLNFAYLCSQPLCLWIKGFLNVFSGPNFISIIFIKIRRILNKVPLFYNISGILVANNVSRSWEQDNSKSGFCLASELILKNHCYWYILWSSIKSNTACDLEQHRVLIEAQKWSCFAKLSQDACNLNPSDWWKRVL